MAAPGFASKDSRGCSLPSVLGEALRRVPGTQGIGHGDMN